MATIVFLAISISGFLLTTLTLYVLSQKQSSSHLYALILAVGLGLTWFLSALVPIFVSGRVRTSLVVLFTLVSLFVTLVAYGAARMWFAHRSRTKS